MNSLKEVSTPVPLIHSQTAHGVSVVIPCLNEVDSIAAVVVAANDGLGPLGVPFEVIVVDNGSTDGSAADERVPQSLRR